MFLNFGLLVNALLVALGIVWCRAMFGRFHEDARRMKVSEDATEKCVIVFYWALTVLILTGIANFAWGIVDDLVVAT